MVLLALVATLAACASVPPPIQEMADARLAIAAARDAGAEKHAPRQLAAAEAAMKSAQQHLTYKSYLAARNEANMAKALAKEARTVAEQHEPRPDIMPEQPLK